jgi:uncharacterized protein (TIGR03437 family)
LVSAIATLAPGAATAQVQVRVANAPVQTVFVLQAALVLTGIGIVTGGNQQTAPGGSFAQPITVQVSTSGAPAAGLQVQFTNSGAPVSISNGGLALTDANGRATVSVQAGSVTGTAIITAAIGNFSTSVSLTIQAAQPALSFLNGASGQSSPISPAEVLSIYGTGIAPGIDGCVPANQAVGPLLFSLSGVTVQFASQGYSSSAPLFSVCNFGPGQESIAVEVPADLPVVDTTVTVQVGDSIVAQTTTPAASVSPGIFETAMSDGVKRALLRRPDGTFVSLESPAQAGERLQAFVTGLGKPVTASGIAIATNQAGISGDDAAPPNPVTIGIADRVLQPVSAIYATDMIGVYVLTFDMPTDAPSGSDVAFTVTTLLDGQSVIGDSTKIPIQ